MINIEQIQQRIMDTDKIQIRASASQPATKEVDILDMSDYAGVVEYYPEELVMTVKAGTSLNTIEQLLADNDQAMPFLASADGASTIGGAYAIGSHALRNVVLGVKVIDGQGRILTFGGQVMKNVAGYDVARLLVGSKGQLAVICEISFKVLPKSYIVNLTDKHDVKIASQSTVRARIEQGLKHIFDPRSVFI